MSNWLNDMAGWDKQTNETRICFTGDPAIDKDKSDLESYVKNGYDEKCLKFKKDKKPTWVTVQMPSSVQAIKLKHELAKAYIEQDTGLMSQVFTEAFACCARLNDIDDAKPVRIGGIEQLPEAFMQFLCLKKGLAEEIYAIGAWICSKAFLDEEEKKQ